MKKMYTAGVALLCFSFFAGCTSIEKVEDTPALQLETTSPAAIPVPAASPAELFDMSRGQPLFISSFPAHFTSETTLSWTAPVTNADGTALQDLESYRIYFGQTKQSLGTADRRYITVSGKTTKVVLYNLSPGQWCFQVTAHDTSGNESDLSTGACVTNP